MDVRRELKIVNAAGLHARPCHALVSTALRFEALLSVSCGDRSVNGKSILELMTLEAGCGSQLLLEARGADAEALVGALAALVESGFDELA